MDESLLSRAFEVAEIPKNFNPAVPPSTGHEYLQYVMYEASKCPKVVVAEIEKSKIKNHVNIHLQSQNFEKIENWTPSVEWQQKQVTIFSNLRKKVEAFKRSKNFVPVLLPDSYDKKKWHKMCTGDENIKPYLSLMLSMKEPFLERILEYQSQWLGEGEGLTPSQGRWIYALLACLSLPLTPDVCSALRDLARQCARLRLSQESSESQEATVLNIIICLVSKYFGQADLGS